MNFNAILKSKETKRFRRWGKGGLTLKILPQCLYITPIFEEQLGYGGAKPPPSTPHPSSLRSIAGHLNYKYFEYKLNKICHFKKKVYQ